MLIMYQTVHYFSIDLSKLKCFAVEMFKPIYDLSIGYMECKK